MDTLNKNDASLGLEIENYLKSLGQHTPLKSNSLSNAQKIEQISFHFQKIMETLGLDLEDDSLRDSHKRVAKMYINEIYQGRRRL